MISIVYSIQKINFHLKSLYKLEAYKPATYVWFIDII
jgi:hypothetical protein